MSRYIYLQSLVNNKTDILRSSAMFIFFFFLSHMYVYFGGATISRPRLKIIYIQILVYTGHGPSIEFIWMEIKILCKKKKKCTALHTFRVL